MIEKDATQIGGHQVQQNAQRKATHEQKALLRSLVVDGEHIEGQCFSSQQIEAIGPFELRVEQPVEKRTFWSARDDLVIGF